MTREDFLSLCLEEYGVTPDYPWIKDPETAVLRHGNNKKWFALVIDIPMSKLGLNSDKVSTVVNMKYSEDMLTAFGHPKGVFPAYHMNKVHWVSVLLDMADDSTVSLILDESFNLTKK